MRLTSLRRSRSAERLPGIAGVARLDRRTKDLTKRLRPGDIAIIDRADIHRVRARRRAGARTQLEAFAANTMEYLLKERALLLDGVGVPVVRTDFTGRHALVVVRGYDYREDLATLRPYIREYRPILIGVDGGADALVEAG